MIHNHQMHQMTTAINMSQPPPQQQQGIQPPTNSQRMNHHHYQQRLNHQQVQQQQQQQHHGSGNRNLNGINHQIPPPIIQKHHLHQNIATLNQKPPPQHGQQPSHSQATSLSSQNSQIQPSQRIPYEKSIQSNNNLKRESSSISVPHSATATLPTNNSSIITGPPSSVVPQSSSLSHHNHPPYLHHSSTLLQKQYHSQQQNEVENAAKIPVVSANKENIPLPSTGSILNSSAEILSPSSEENTELGIQSLANAKEKTPMCLVNELARFNKILHQYRLVKESGPAHKKRFTVVLKLGDEEYAAEDLSIKKAQHAAARDAIMKTNYKHPPFKKNRVLKGVQIAGKGSSGNITPTVELNALAMKRGEPTTYTVIVCNQMPTGSNAPLPPYGQPPPFVRNAPFQRKFGNQRGGSSNMPSSRFNSQFNGTEVFEATLSVGTRTFLGMGPTQQAARHDAAARALDVLKPITTDNDASKLNTSTGSCGSNSENDGDDSLISDIKSPISIVHEMALKRKLTVSFEVQSEKGPPHMKVYMTLCKVGTIVTEGEGNGKKLSKKKAAEKMMDELKKLPPPSPVEELPTRGNQNRGRRKQQLQQTPITKKKSRNLIKEKLEQSAPTDEINPISQLIQIQQARKEKEPIYNVVDERGTARRREFIIEVSASGSSATGTGPNKKVAKKIAAENLLISMGVLKTSSIANEIVAKEKQQQQQFERNKKVSFNEPDANKRSSSKSTNPRQIAPGILIVNSSDESFSTPTKSTVAPLNNKESPTTTATTVASSTTSSDHPVAAEKSTSPHSNVSNNDSGIGENGVSPRDQLNYLAQLIGFQVSYSDFPKGNHTEFLSLVTLTTDPPHMSHGSGSSIDESRDHAALKALGALSELGLDNVKPKISSK